MPKEFDVTPYIPLLSRAEEAFLADVSYAIAIARPASALAARRRAKEAENVALDGQSVLS